MNGETCLRDFYANYLDLLGKGAASLPLEEFLALFRSRLTPEFIAEAYMSGASLDADPLLDAQDYDESWQKHIRVARQEARGSHEAYLVCLGAEDGMRHAMQVVTETGNKDLLIRAVRATAPVPCAPAAN